MDYDYSAEEVGLAEGFQPSVKVSCVGGTMKIRVDTLTPFQGIIHGPNRTEPGCSVMGKSGLKTYLNIDLTRPEGALVSLVKILASSQKLLTTKTQGEMKNSQDIAANTSLLVKKKIA